MLLVKFMYLLYVRLSEKRTDMKLPKGCLNMVQTND